MQRGMINNVDALKSRHGGSVALMRNAKSE